MAEPKTRPNDNSVKDHLDSFGGKVSEDAHKICVLFSETTGQPPRMWGDAIIGFGETWLKYASGRELNWMSCGFAVRKNGFAIYLMHGLENYADLLARLGCHKTSKACIYVDKLEKIDLAVLREMISRSV
ncbi:MAG: DUF1801 domain-containing protein [bacterium]